MYSKIEPEDPVVKKEYSGGGNYKCPYCASNVTKPIVNTCGHYICANCEQNNLILACSLCKDTFLSFVGNMVDEFNE